MYPEQAARAAGEENNMSFLIAPLSSILLWGILLAVFVVVEAATVNLVTVWFAVGALAALISGAFTRSLLAQVLVFLVVSAIALAVSKPFMDKARHMRPAAPLGLERNLGRQATVVQAIRPEAPGRVRLDGVDWTAVCACELAEGALCTVTGISGTTLRVEPQRQSLHSGETQYQS